MSKFKIGTRIVFLDGTNAFYLGDDILAHVEMFGSGVDVTSFQEFIENGGMEDSRVNTVFEPSYAPRRKEMFLTQEEKTEIKRAIDLIPGDVVYIGKYWGKPNTQYIEIAYKPTYDYKIRIESFCLPYFEPNTKYKGLEIGEKYKLGELGL